MASWATSWRTLRPRRHSIEPRPGSTSTRSVPCSHGSLRRERAVLSMRFGLDRSDEPRTLADIGDGYKLTRERIRQIEAKALTKLRHPCTARITESTIGWAEPVAFRLAVLADRPPRPGQRNQRAGCLVLQLRKLLPGEPASLDDLDRDRSDRIRAAPVREAGAEDDIDTTRSGVDDHGGLADRFDLDADLFECLALRRDPRILASVQ